MSPQPISFSDEVAKDHSRAFVQDVIVLAWGYLSCLLWQLGYPRQAEAAGRQSARRQHSRLWELRAAVALARHWGENGNMAAARDVLAPVYGWFSEGLDTADLQRARLLLERLD
jgi:hypothetical protein